MSSMTNVQIIVHYIHSIDNGGWVCHNLIILALASCWLKNVTNNSKLTPKSHQAARRTAIFKKFFLTMLGRRATLPYYTPCWVAMLSRPLGPLFKNTGTAPELVY